MHKEYMIAKNYFFFVELENGMFIDSYEQSRLSAKSITVKNEDN